MRIWGESPFSCGALCDPGAGVAGVAQAAGTVTAAGINAVAATHAADEQAKSAQNALDFTKQQFNAQQTQLAPYISAGQNGVNRLLNGFNDQSLTDDPYQNSNLQLAQSNATYDNGNFATPAPFQPAANTTTAAFNPTLTPQNDPGYQFRYDQGLQALQRSQAATGITGGAAAKAAIDYGQAAGSQEYENAYGRALQSSQANQSINAQNFGQALNTSQANNATALAGYQANTGNALNRFNTSLAGTQANNTATLNSNTYNQNSFLTGQGNAYNRYMALAGVGQAGLGQSAANSQSAVNQVGNLSTQQGNAAAAGTIGVSNALAGAVQGLSNQFAYNYGANQQIPANAITPTQGAFNTISPTGVYY